MRDIYGVNLYTGTREERLPDFSFDFPYIASRVNLNEMPGRETPWHWHKAIELFYVEKGYLTYCTPGGETMFQAGMGGLVNTGVLHRTYLGPSAEALAFLHIFDPSILAGQPGSRIDQKYIAPVVSSGAEIIVLRPEDAAQSAVLENLRKSFREEEQAFGYEIRLRSVLSTIWVDVLACAGSLAESSATQRQTNEKIKTIMAYVHEHYAERIAVGDLAAICFSSERECFRLFQNCLHTTPVAYLRSVRLQAACRLLEEGRMPVTEIGQLCGLGSSSYFGKVFREAFGCTPQSYRKKWQDRNR